MKVINYFKNIFDMKNVISIHNFILLFIIFLIFYSIFNNKIIEGNDDECSQAKQQLEDNNQKQINDLKTQITNLNDTSNKLNETTTANAISIKDLDTKYTKAITLLQQSKTQGNNVQEQATNESNKSKNVKDNYK